MVRWKSLLNLDGNDRRHHLQNERHHLLPVSNGDSIPFSIPPKEVTKVALRLKYLIEQIIPYEIDEARITKANSPILTKDVEKTAKGAAGEDNGACVVFCLMVCRDWFKRQSVLELYDSELHAARATAAEMLAKHIIESEEDQDHLMQEVLLRRYSTVRDGHETVPANVVERAVDVHALQVIGSSGYQKCISYLWRGWLVQDDRDPYNFVHYKKRSSTNYWDHFDPDRMRVPLYQNLVQVFFSVLFLVLYSQVINSINITGDIDVVEGILYVFTLGFIADELVKLWKVGRYYITFWNVFNSTLYALLTTSFIMRMIALSKSSSHDIEHREKYNQLSYNFLAFSAPMFWMRLLLYLDTFRFFGAMLVVLKVMMKESLIFFALLLVVLVGFLQAFVGMDYVDTDKDATAFIVKSMANTVMQSPDFSGFEKFAPPFGIILYYIFTFVVMVVLLNILIALYNSAYSEITDHAIDEYMALFSLRTIQFVRAPDENVFIAPFNLIEILFLIIPFEWWLPSSRYERLNNLIMGIIYSPLLLITAYIETRQAQTVNRNRRRGQADEDTTEEWEQLIHELDFEAEGWAKKVGDVKPNIEEEAAVLEVRKLEGKVEELMELIGTGKKEGKGESKGKGMQGDEQGERVDGEL
ncbi:MAG: hypothetical protein M1823_000239 [Watsoniomyces obsoletus]|nr:MAG: hypothetical protein M1823_000239 [Watsoniomyces obsoletus]